MSDNTLKYFVAAAIALLLVFQIGTLIAGIFGTTWGIVSAVVVAVVAFFSAKLARAAGKSSLWFLLPILITGVVHPLHNFRGDNHARHLVCHKVSSPRTF